ncbi:hypothetical protein BGW39_002770, partial [Mortierella sp. 14UC]
MSSKQKKTTSNSRPATPNAAQSEAAHRKSSSISLLDKAKRNVLGVFNKKQVKTVFHAVATTPLGPVGIAVSQDHQGKSTLASDVTRILETSTLHPAVAPNSIEVESRARPALLSSTQQLWLSMFTENVVPPALLATLPPPGVRFDNTAQLAHCGNLLRRCLSPSSAAASTPDEPLDPTQQALIEPYARNEDEASRIRSLIQRVVEKFAADNLKTFAILSEVLLLAPCLDQEYYRKLLNCVIAEFETARFLDLALLQGLVQLVESASPDYLEPDDLALSRLWDVMVERKVKDLRRVVDQELLSVLFSQLKDSEDPYLKHQAIYAFQGLLHVPNDETRRQCMLRYAGNITMGLLGVASLQAGSGTAQGRGRPSVRYTGLRETQQHVRNGRLQEFNILVIEAPCRDHIEFQWGVCRWLGNIADDPLWETSTRRHAVDFFAELYRNDSTQTLSEDIDQWILIKLRQIKALADPAIFDHAQMVLQSLKSTGDAAKQGLYRDTLAAPLCPYPIQVRLPTPTSSTLLSQVLAIPAVEYDLLRLKNRRLKELKNALYIQPQAKLTLQSPDDTLFSLMEKVRDFLAGPGLVFLLLGDSGGGKSTFSLELERALWKTYKKGDPISLYINLPSIGNPPQNIIGKQLQELEFTDTQTMELKQNREFIVICDGYDESQLTGNIYTSNHFKRNGQRKIKMVVTCRTQYLGSEYRNRFEPQGSSAYDHAAPNLFQEAVIAPFTKKQIKRYVEIYDPQVSYRGRTTCIVY